jgi:hypothetical protein
MLTLYGASLEIQPAAKPPAKPPTPK